MDKGKVVVIGILIFSVFGNVNKAMSSENWAVWVHNVYRPGQVSVAPVGSLSEPWRIDSIWNSDTKGAWKKACWLVRNGDVSGQRYSSSKMNTRQVLCDQNCNCQHD